MRLEKRLYSNGYYLSVNKAETQKPDQEASSLTEQENHLTALATIESVIPVERLEEFKPVRIEIKRQADIKKASVSTRSVFSQQQKESKKLKAKAIRKSNPRDKSGEEFPEETITLIILGFLLIGLIMFMIFVPVTQSWLIILGILALIVIVAILFSLIGFVEPGVFFPVLGGGGGMIIGILQYLYYLGII